MVYGNRLSSSTDSISFSFIFPLTLCTVSLCLFTSQEFVVLALSSSDGVSLAAPSTGLEDALQTIV